MKKAMITIIIFLFITNVYAACVIRLRVIEYPPVYFKNDSGNWTGFAVEQAEAVITEAGCKVLYRNAPWGRALVLIQEGELDMMGSLSITEERKKFLNFIGPQFFEEMKMWVAENSNYQIKKHEDLKHLPQKVALLQDAWYGKEIENLMKDKFFTKRIIQTTSSATSAIYEKIRLGRISGYIDTVTPGMHKHNLYKGLKVHPFVFNSNPVYFGLSKKSVNQALFERLKKALEQVKKRGEFEKILKKYE